MQDNDHLTINVDLEIFVVKIFSWYCANHENKKHELYFTIARTFLFAQFHSLQPASYFARDGLFDTSMSLELMANALQLFAQCPINRYCHSTCLWRYWVPFCTLVVRQQLQGSHESIMQALRTTYTLACAVSFQITKCWRHVSRQKIFVSILATTKRYFHAKNLRSHENFCLIYGELIILALEYYSMA